MNLINKKYGFQRNKKLNCSSFKFQIQHEAKKQQLNKILQINTEQNTINDLTSRPQTTTNYKQETLKQQIYFKPIRLKSKKLILYNLELYKSIKNLETNITSSNAKNALLKIKENKLIDSELQMIENLNQQQIQNISTGLTKNEIFIRQQKQLNLLLDNKTQQINFNFKYNKTPKRIDNSTLIQKNKENVKKFIQNLKLIAHKNYKKGKEDLVAYNKRYISYVFEPKVMFVTRKDLNAQIFRIDPWLSYGSAIQVKDKQQRQNMDLLKKQMLSSQAHQNQLGHYKYFLQKQGFEEAGTLAQLNLQINISPKKKFQVANREDFNFNQYQESNPSQQEMKNDKDKDIFQKNKKIFQKKQLDQEGKLFFKAVKNNDLHEVDKFLYYNPFLILSQDFFHRSPLHYAAIRGYNRMYNFLKQIYEKHSQKFNKDIFGKTAQDLIDFQKKIF